MLALIAYVPSLLSSPGRMPADTKLYLYLDPGGLISRAPKAWDPSQFGGWVPHQMIQYLWPTGPWYWVCDRLGVPDWVAHRLWIATLMFLAGFGVFRFARALRLPVAGAAITALVYQLSPYLLPYISRTSVMLLPWAALGWLLTLTMRAVREGGWRAPAWIALVVCSAAGVNATAFAVILPAPMIWMALEWRAARVSTRQVLTASLRIGLLSIAASLWWVAMLVLQSRHGADVLSYSETLDAVAYTTNSMEVMRGLGYWLFYVNDPYGPATTASFAYQQSALLILVGAALMLICLLGIALTRFAHRRFAALLVATGLVIAVGVHPFADPSPAAGALRSSGLALALRSSTRAIPLIALGMGLGAAALLDAVATRRARLGVGLRLVVVLLIAVNLPSLWTADLVDPALERDQDPPDAWIDAAHALAASDVTARVLQLPGAEFGAFRWGYTVDPPLPGLTDKPLLTRDLLPLGSAQLMDLLYALDDRVQSGQLDPASLAPVARLLTVDRLWVSGDIAFERFRTLRPELFADQLAVPPVGLSAATSYGTAAANSATIPMVDEDALGNPLIGTPVVPVQLLTVDDATTIARLATHVVVVDGSGDGLVDAASAGLLFGDEAVRYAAELSAADWQRLPSDTVFLVTDSNRDRDRQWRGSQDTTGMTESGGPDRDGQNDSTAAVRLPVFGTQDGHTQTVATLDGGITAQASSYGDPFALFPEDRAAMAVDGDTDTGWRVGLRWAPIGEHLTLGGSNATTLHLLQLQGPQLRRMITAVDIEVDGHVQRVTLDERSLVGSGQPVSVPDGNEVRLTIRQVADRPGAPMYGEDSVGFAELGPIAQEWVRPPTVVLSQAPATATVALVFRRDSSRATDRWRSDPEPTLARRFDLVHALEGSLTLQLRLSERADDAALDALAGDTSTPTANRRLTGVPTARASAAFDHDRATRWTTPFNVAVGSALTVPLAGDAPLESFRFLQPNDDQHSPITSLRISAGDSTRDVVVGTPDSDGFTTVTFPAVSADQVTIEITGVQRRTTVERRLGQDAELPAAITEITGLPLATRHATPAECRTDLLTIDGRPVAVRVDAEAVLSGRLVTTTLCDASTLRLDAGRHQFLSASGRRTGIDVESISVEPSSLSPAQQHAAPVVHLDAFDATSATVTVPPHAEEQWLIFGEGYNAGWTATAGGHDLGAPTPISGGSNGWLLPATTDATTVHIEFTPQQQLDLLLVASAGGVGVCLLLAVWPSMVGVVRRRRIAPQFTVEAPDEHAVLVAPWSRSDTSAARLAACVLVGVCALFLSLSWGMAAVLVAAMLWRRGQLRLAALTGVVGLGALGAVEAAVSLVRHTPSGMSWVGQLEPIHRPGVFLVLLFAVATASDPDDEPTDTQPAPHEP